jgi:Tfp pilus assembly protein PilV
LISKYLKNERGESLIQVMIAAAIAFIVIAAVTSIMANQQKQISQTNQKLASLDLLRVVSTALADTPACTYMITQPPQPAFDPLAVGTANSPVFNLQRIPSTSLPGGPIAIKVSSTESASPLSNSLFVQSITVGDLSCGTAACTATSNTFSANVTVTFDSAKLITQLHPLKFPILFHTTGPANSQSIANCGGGSAPSCAADTISFCDLPATTSGAVTGTCASPTTGTCSYSCTLGTWTNPSSNSCTAGRKWTSVGAAVLNGFAYCAGFSDFSPNGACLESSGTQCNDVGGTNNSYICQ